MFGLHTQLSNKPFLMIDIDEAIDNLKKRKAPGVDGNTTEFYKAMDMEKALLNLEA